MSTVDRKPVFTNPIVTELCAMDRVALQTAAQAYMQKRGDLWHAYCAKANSHAVGDVKATSVRVADFENDRIVFTVQAAGEHPTPPSFRYYFGPEVTLTVAFEGEGLASLAQGIKAAMDEAARPDLVIRS